MKVFTYAILLAGIAGPASAGPARYESPQAASKPLRPVPEKRQQFPQGQPISADGNGGPILGA